MTPLLSAYGRNVFSQHGEDGMLEHLFAIIGIEHRRCAEVGAHDGLHLSNTALWWRQGWNATLIEADRSRFELLRQNTADTDHIITLDWRITPDNINAAFAGDYDLLSLDVDGDEYLLWTQLAARPRVMVVEFNQTVPWWYSIRPRHTGGQFGASAAALHWLGNQLGYQLLGRTDCNLIFVRQDIYDANSETLNYETRLNVLLPIREQTILATDYDGRELVLGRTPPWGHVHEPVTEELDIQ